MRKLVLISILSAIVFGCNMQPRSILVEAYYEEEISPDKAVLGLELSEYWREELVPGTRYEDYQNRGISLDEIEKNAVKVLSDAGMPPEALVVVDSGTKYRPNSGRDLLAYRRYQINLSNLNLIQPLLSSLRGPEVTYFRLDQLTHSDIEGLKGKAGKMALDIAYSKAKIIISDHGEIGQLLTAQQGNTELILPVVGTMPRTMAAAPMGLQSDIASPQGQELSYNKIKVSSTIWATFKLK